MLPLLNFCIFIATVISIAATRIILVKYNCIHKTRHSISDAHSTIDQVFKLK